MSLQPLVDVIEQMQTDTKRSPVRQFQVISLDPLTVDDLTTPSIIPVKPLTVYRPTVIGERVYGLKMGNRILVLGKCGGVASEPEPEPDPEPADIYLTGSAGSGVWYRRHGNEIQITANIDNTHTITAAGVAMGTMPVGLRPALAVTVPGTLKGGAGLWRGQLAINPAGVVTAWSFDGNTTYFCAQLRYPL